MGAFARFGRRGAKAALLAGALGLGAMIVPISSASAAVPHVDVQKIGDFVYIDDWAGNTMVFIGADGTVSATVAGTQTQVRVDNYGCQTKTFNSVRCFNTHLNQEVPIFKWTVQMHDGDDTVWSLHASQAEMLGQAGNDFLIASTGAGDTLNGGAGRDALIVREAAPQFTPKKDFVDCGGGAGGDGEFDIFQVDALDVVSHCPAPDQQW